MKRRQKARATRHRRTLGKRIPTPTPVPQPRTRTRNHIRSSSHVASLIYEVRTQAGLSQKELAERIGTRQPVISRLEDADYEGHSLSMLIRIAETLDHELEIKLVPHKKASRERVPRAGVRRSG